MARGTSLTDRLLVLFSGSPVIPAGWPSTNAFPRAHAGRMLNAWVAKLLGDPRQVRCTVERLDDATGTVVATSAFPLSDVPVTPLDLVYSVDAPAPTAAPSTSLSDIEQLVLYQARIRAGGFGSTATLRLQHTRPTNLAARESTLFDLIEHGRAIRQMLENARGAIPEDLKPPDRDCEVSIDVADLEARVAGALYALNAASKALATLVQTGPAATSDALRTRLLAFGNFGITPAIPCVATGDDSATRSALLRQATALLKSGAQRLNQFTALRALPVAAEPRARCDQLIEQVRAVFGSAYVMLPTFTCDAAGATELTIAIAASTAQLPLSRSGRWVGLPPIARQDLPAGKLSLVLQTPYAIKPMQPLSGLLVPASIDTACRDFSASVV